jgi:zinc transport system substrate-binding protein
MAGTGRKAALAILCTIVSTVAALADAPVVATIKPIHALVSAVMAGAGEPKLLIDGAASPHTYSLKPSDARLLQSARVVFRVSPGLEVFLNRVVKSLPATTTVVSLEAAPGLTLLPMRSGGTFDEHRHEAAASGPHRHGDDAGHDHDKGATDAHIWLDPNNAKAIVRYMADRLAAVDATNAALYRANADAMAGKLDALGDELGRDLAPLAGKGYVVFHDAYQYLEHRYGLAAIGSVTISPENAPSAKRLTQLRRKVVRLKAQCIFAEPQFEPKLVATIAEGTGIRVGTLDPNGAAIPAGPQMYEALMRSLATNLKSCLLPSG